MCHIFSIVSKVTLHFKYVPKNKQNKLQQMKKNEIKKECYLNCTTTIKYALFPYF